MRGEYRMFWGVSFRGLIDEIIVFSPFDNHWDV